VNGATPKDPGVEPALDDEPVGTVAEEAFKLLRAIAREQPDAIASVTQSATVLVRSLRDLVDTALAPRSPQEEQ
jgi:hypothetical protein